MSNFGQKKLNRNGVRVPTRGVVSTVWNYISTYAEEYGVTPKLSQLQDAFPERPFNTLKTVLRNYLVYHGIKLTRGGITQDLSYVITDESI